MPDYVPVGPDDALRYLVAISSDAREPREQERGLEHLLSDRQLTLVEILRLIEAEMALRKRLSRKARGEAQQQYRYVKAKLFVLDAYPLGSNRAWEMRRSALEKELDGLNKEQRAERATCFADIAKLSAEWRSWFKQYRDALLRTRLIAPGERGSRYRNHG